MRTTSALGGHRTVGVNQCTGTMVTLEWGKVHTLSLVWTSPHDRTALIRNACPL